MAGNVKKLIKEGTASCRQVWKRAMKPDKFMRFYYFNKDLLPPTFLPSLRRKKGLKLPELKPFFISPTFFSFEVKNFFMSKIFYVYGNFMQKAGAESMSYLLQQL